MTEWLVIAVVAAGTYLERASLMLMPERLTLPHRLERILRYVGPAVLAALAIPPLLAPHGTFDPVSPHIAAAALAAFVAWRSHSLLATLVAGLVTFGALIGLL